VSLKLAVLSLGLWLAGSHGVAALACCSGMTAPKAACQGCGDHQERDSFSQRPDCCASLEAQQDVEASIPKSEIRGFPDRRPQLHSVAP
jgi:hypothetical protein